MKEYLFRPKFNRFDTIVLVLLALIVNQGDLGFNFGSALCLLALIAAAFFSTTMEESLNDEALSKKAR